MKAFCISLLVVLVGSLVEGRFFHSVGDSSLEQVKKILSSANDYLEKKNLYEISTPDLSYNNFYSSGSIKNARFAQLSSFEAVGENQFINKTEADVTLFYYDVSVGLKKFLVSYDYQYSFMFFLRGSGHAEISAKKNAAQLTGTVTKRKDGSCTGFLEKAVLTELGEFEATITPPTTAHKLLASFMTFIKNHILPSDIPIFNKLISDGIARESFKKIFSEVACQSFNEL